MAYNSRYAQPREDNDGWDSMLYGDFGAPQLDYDLLAQIAANPSIYTPVAGASYTAPTAAAPAPQVVAPTPAAPAVTWDAVQAAMVKAIPLAEMRNETPTANIPGLGLVSFVFRPENGGSYQPMTADENGEGEVWLTEGPNNTVVGLPQASSGDSGGFLEQLLNVAGVYAKPAAMAVGAHIANTGGLADLLGSRAVDTGGLAALGEGGGAAGPGVLDAAGGFAQAVDPVTQAMLDSYETGAALTPASGTQVASAAPGNSGALWDVAQHVPESILNAGVAGDAAQYVPESILNAGVAGDAAAQIAAQTATEALALPSFSIAPAATAVPPWLGPVGQAAGGVGALAAATAGGEEDGALQLPSTDSWDFNPPPYVPEVDGGPDPGIPVDPDTGEPYTQKQIDDANAASQDGIDATAGKVVNPGYPETVDPESKLSAIKRIAKATGLTEEAVKGLVATGVISAAALEDPDRTSTTKVEYPEWYNEASKSAIALADKYAALGPDAVAPLSENENAAIQMAKDSAGTWQPLLDKSTGALDASRQFFDEAGALAGTVPGYLDRATGQIDASMPYFKQAGDMAATVPGYLKRAGEQVDASMPYFKQAGDMVATVPGYLKRAGEQVDAAKPYFDKAGAMADSVGGYLARSGALADEAAGGIPGIDLSAYMNPYLDNILAPLARRNEIAKAQALNDIKAKAGMRGAFGEDRSTLLESQTAEAADRNLNEAEANIRSGAFTTGLTAAQADLARKLAASGQWGALAGTAGNTAGIYGNLGKGVADSANIFNNAGTVAIGGANALTATGRGVADTAGAFTGMGTAATNGANALTATGRSVADTAGAFTGMGTAATNAANAKTNAGRSLTDTAGGYRGNASAFGTLTDADIARLMSTGGTARSVEQAKRNAPLTAIGGYANALRGNPGATTTNVAPEASKVGQAAGALTTLLGADKAGWF